MALILLVCATACTPASQTGTTTSIPVGGTVSASPVCPIVRNPPDPACSPRPVRGAVIVVLGENGREVTRGTSGADGGFRLNLPPGTYRVVPQPVEGLIGAPSATDLAVEAGSQPPDLVIVYDTGIR